MSRAPRQLRRLTFLAVAIVWFLLNPATQAFAQAAADYPLSDGHFYSEANGQGGGPGQTGFAITDDSSIPFWSTFSANGGVNAFGYPISTRFLAAPNTDQALQKAIFQWDGTQVSLVNVLDVLHDDGLDALLQSRYLTPPPADTTPDANLSWPQIVARHQQFLASNPAIQTAYFGVSDPLTIYGLPMSQPTPEANGAVIVVRLQRAVLQQWLTPQPWATPGQVTVANAGDIAKTAGLLPASSLIPQAPTPAADPSAPAVPYPVSATTSENWSGYIAATDLNNGQPGTVSDVKATWKVPPVNCKSTPDATVGVWVGMDGVFSPTVEQTGTASACNGGQASYYAWLEIYPAAARTSAMPISPGDTISAEVQALGHSRFQLTLNDLTSGRGFSVQRPSPGSRDSAEWVVEAPAVGDQIAALANFSSIAFTNGGATINGQPGTINGPGWLAGRVGMVGDAGQLRAVASPLDPTGQSFTVAWQRP